MNGDGFADIIIGTPDGDGSGNTTPGAGEVWVIYGQSSLPTAIDLNWPPSGVNTTVFYGEDDGLSRIAIGDVNDDGYDDIIMTAIFGDGPGNSRTNSGDVWVYYGRPSMPLGAVQLSQSPQTPNTTIIFGERSDIRLGINLSSGDVNGDGIEDILIGTPFGKGPDGTQTDLGEVWVIYGSTSGLPVQIDLASPPANATVIYGRAAGEQFASALASGDVNGDGIDDIVSASPLSNVGATDAGAYWLIYGGSTLPGQTIMLQNPPANTTVIYGADAGDQIGSVIDNSYLLPDFNGDGYGDLPILIPYGDGPSNTRPGSGEAWLIFGNQQRLQRTYRLNTPPSDANLFYGNSGSYLGYAFGVGDFNGDGISDVAFGAPNDDPFGRTNAGSVSVSYGRPHHTYVVKSDTYSFIDATGGTDIGLNCNDCCKKVSIGFDFEYFGEKYQDVYICDDGYISFSLVLAPSPLRFCPPSRHEPHNIIAAFQDNLNPSAGGAVYTLLEGTAPNRRFTIEWFNVPVYPNTGNATFEITLFETSNQILVQYQDTTFGNSSDNGAQAMAGLENRVGLVGKAYSCNAPNLTPSTAWRAIPIGMYRLFADTMENGINGWTVTGSTFWHQESTSCSPNSRSPATSWYYGSASTCTYEWAGGAHSGSLISPQISADYYGRLTLWERYNVYFGDSATKYVSTDGGTSWTSIQTYSNKIFSNGWESNTYDLDRFSGNPLTLKFEFVADGASDTTLGWMIDNVEIEGCDVFGTTPIIQALAYARPTPVCETNSYLLDGTGTFANGCSSPLSYQWYENGNPIKGATTLQYTIPSGHPVGLFTYTLEATCSTPSATDMSDPITVEVVKMPGEVPPSTFRLAKTGGGTQIHFTWTNILGADYYHIYQDTSANGSFTTITTTASSGTVGATVAMPSDPILFYLVAGANDTCGVGPKKQ